VIAAASLKEAACSVSAYAEKLHLDDVRINVSMAEACARDILQRLEQNEGA